MTIGELSARSGVAAPALRYCERIGLIRAGRSGGNQRRYPRAELRRVAFIRIAQRVGVPRSGCATGSPAASAAAVSR